MKLKPLFDRVVLKATKLEEEKVSSIITEIDENKSDIGEVIELGTGGKIDNEEIKFQVKVGDKVLYNKFATSEFTYKKDTYILLKQVDIIAIIENWQL